MIEQLLQDHDIQFRPSGKDYLIRCLNPDHEDKNPSLRVDRITGIFNCLSCGFSGNIFHHFGKQPNMLDQRRRRLTSLIEQKLADTTGLSPPENAVSFDSDWRGISSATFIKFGAFQHNNPEFIGRVVIPIRGISGKIVGFCGRHQSQGDPKYLFHPAGVKYPLFPVVKPIEGRVVIVEGIFDMMNLQDKGLSNAVCAFGVNKLTTEKLNILKMQGVVGIDLFYDSDDAGQSAAEKDKLRLEELDFSVRVVSNPLTKDPGELTALQVLKLKETLYSG